MAVRNCKDIGENLHKIVDRLLANESLVKLLYYADSDPLSKENLADEIKKKEVFEKLIKIVPRVTNTEFSHSIISIRVIDGNKLSENSEFREINFSLEIFVPWEQWLIKDSNLRPFAILGEIQSSLDGKTVNGLGKMSGGDFSLSYMTEEIACYEQTFSLTAYD